MIKKTMFVAAAVGGALFAGCSSARQPGADSGASSVVLGYGEATPVKLENGEGLNTPPPSQVIPKATVYRMSGDYADYVPVTLTPDGHSLVSFPAPTDLSQSSRPLPLADGFYLDRRGVGTCTAFTRYTYAEYMALPAAPSPSELLASLIPGAVVTEVVRLPFTLSQAEADTAAVNTLIRTGFPGCTPLTPISTAR